MDAKGCPIDSDGDGVFDGLDQCPDTPAGAKIDAVGCPIDSDGDGVFDGLDQCPDTPKGLKVDAKGCPIEVVERETELFDTGLIRLEQRELRDRQGEPDAGVVPDARRRRARCCVKWPQLKIEIGGHTDSRGSAERNLLLSQARADSVRAYVMNKYPALQPAQFTVKGYGLTRPIASNTGRPRPGEEPPRRVRGDQPDVLKKEIEKRHLLMQGEGAPADTTKK